MKVGTGGDASDGCDREKFAPRLSIFFLLGCSENLTTPPIQAVPAINQHSKSISHVSHYNDSVPISVCSMALPR